MPKHDDPFAQPFKKEIDYHQPLPGSREAWLEEDNKKLQAHIVKQADRIKQLEKMVENLEGYYRSHKKWIARADALIATQSEVMDAQSRLLYSGRSYTEALADWERAKGEITEGGDYVTDIDINASEAVKLASDIVRDHNKANIDIGNWYYEDRESIIFYAYGIFIGLAYSYGQDNECEINTALHQEGFGSDITTAEDEVRYLNRKLSELNHGFMMSDGMIKRLVGHLIDKFAERLESDD